MKKIILIILCCIIKISSAQTESNIDTEYNFKKGDTLVVIKLLKNNRVLFEEHPKQEIKPRENFSSVTPNGKMICSMQSLIYFQSYGTYKLTDSKIILSFKDENPIEDVDLKIVTDNSNEKGVVLTKRNDTKFEDTYFDLFVYQNEKEVCQIISFSNECEFFLDDRNSPLIIKYEKFNKTVDLPPNGKIEINVLINDLKGHNHIKNKTLTFDISKLNKNN